MSRVVLVVDDEALVGQVIASMLEDLGCIAINAGSGREALVKLANDDRIEILITDVHMAEMDGYELAERARCAWPHLKVILCSGRADYTGELPLIRKPFAREDLAQMMSRTTGLC
jgi:CheY-like chemotaxis protein